MDHSRLSMPLGDAIFSQRAIRRFRPEPIPVEDLRLILEAAVKAPNGANRQLARFLVLTDPEKIHQFGTLYHEAWWAKRRDEQGWRGPQDIPPDDRNHQSAMRLADEIKDAPCIIFALALPPGPANSVLPAVQNLQLAARALGIGSVPTTLHPQVMDRFYAMFDIPPEVAFHFCIPLGYPQGNFGPTRRLPTSETTYFNAWSAPPPWS